MNPEERQKAHDIRIMDMGKTFRAIARSTEGERFRAILEEIRDHRINGASEIEIGSKLGQRDLALDFLFLMEPLEENTDG